MQNYWILPYGQSRYCFDERVFYILLIIKFYEMNYYLML